MKKYIEIKKHEEFADGDECRYLYSEEWRPNVHRSQTVGFEYRRPVPHAGDVQFLMAVSILVPVIVNCDGREQESIEAEAGELAYQKVLDDPQKYVNYESIDWANCKVDDIQPEPSGMDRLGALQAGIDKGFINDSIDTEPKNPGNKALDYCNAQHNQGLGTAWRIFNRGNSENEVLQVQRIDEPEYEGVELTPLESDETALEIAKSLGWKLDENGYVLAYPGEEPKNPGKYRMLEVGDTIQTGDEVWFSDGWAGVSLSVIGETYSRTKFLDMRRPITEPQKKNIYDDEGNPIFKKSVVPRYRPFVEGDVIEEGDQVVLKTGEWVGFSPGAYGETIEPDLVHRSRKIIK